MQDRYLFRGKRIDNHEWVTGHYVEGNISGCWIYKIINKQRM